MRRSTILVAFAALTFLFVCRAGAEEKADYVPPVNALGEWKKNDEAVSFNKRWHACDAEPADTGKPLPDFCANEPEDGKDPFPKVILRLTQGVESARTRGSFKSRDLDKLEFTSPHNPNFGQNPQFEVFNKNGHFKVDWDAYIQDITKIATHESQLVFPIYRYKGPQPGEIHDYLLEIITHVKPAFCRWHSEKYLELKRPPDLEKGPVLQEGVLPFYLLAQNCLHDPQDVWYRVEVLGTRSNRMPKTDIEQVRAAAMGGNLDSQITLVSSMAPWAKDDPEQFYFWSSIVVRRGGRVLSGDPNEFAKASLQPGEKEGVDQRISNLFKAHPELLQEQEGTVPDHPDAAPSPPATVGQ